jgi:lysophospholipase
VRAQGIFDPQALKDQLGTFSELGAPIASALTVDYRRFYQFDFEAASPGLAHHMGWLDCDGERLAVQLFVPQAPRGSVVFCHGYFDHVGLFEHLLRYLLGKQLAVLAFDQIGHGLSSGERATIDSFDRYVAALERVRAVAAGLLPAPCYGVGQSTGCAVLMEHALQHGVTFDELILFAPLVRPAHWGVNRLVYQVAKRTVKDRPRAVTENAENPEFMHLQRNDPLAPTRLPVQWVTAMVDWMHAFEANERLPQVPFVLQGDTDGTVAGRYNLKVLQRLVAPAELPVLWLEGGRHHLPNESAALRAQMWAWLDERVPWPTVAEPSPKIGA